MENVELVKALVKAQSEMSNAVKGSSNPFFKNKYADLNSIREAVIPHLNKNGIVVLQPLVVIDGETYVKTLLLHESGQSIESLIKVIVSRQNDAQSQGSGITYARRYGLQSFVCIGADDDDGNNASNPEQAQSQPQQNELPWLSDKEFNGLMEKGTIEQYENAKSQRRIKKDFKTQLEQKFNQNQ